MCYLYKEKNWNMITDFEQAYNNCHVTLSGVSTTIKYTDTGIPEPDGNNLSTCATNKN